MTSADPRATCVLLNLDCGTGEQRRLARLLGWHYSRLGRKLNAKR